MYDIAVAHGTSPYVSAYPWTPGVGFGAKYADPAALPAGIGQGVAFSSFYLPIISEPASIAPRVAMMQ